MLPLIAALTAALAIAFLLLAFAGRRNSMSPAERIERLRGEIPTETGNDESFGNRIALPAARGVGGAVMSIMPASIVRQIDRGLVAAGRPMTVPGFILFELLLGSFFGALAAAVAFRSLSVSVPVGVVIVALAVLTGGALMPMLLRSKIGKRRAQIWRSLLDAADLLTTCVEAGMGIDAALARVAAEIHGPLKTELRTALQEIALGKPRRDAFVDVGIRTGVDDLQAMLAAISQAEESGTSLGPVLRAQARHIRTRRRLSAEEQARMVPAKMVFPIVFLIIPTIFVLILGPLAVEIMEVLPL